MKEGKEADIQCLNEQVITVGNNGSFQWGPLMDYVEQNRIILIKG